MWWDLIGYAALVSGKDDDAKTKCVLSAALALSLLSLRSRLEDCLSHIYLKHINKTETTGNAIKTMKNENETNVSSSFG